MEGIFMAIPATLASFENDPASVHGELPPKHWGLLM